MAETPIQYRGTMYFLRSKSSEQVFFDGVQWRSDLSVGGGPIYPPEGGGGGLRPSHPIALPGDPWWGQDLHPAHPIVIPPNVPPDLQPPTPPQPGDPTTAVPGNWPVQPVVPPPYIVVNYPGIGPVTVAPPAQAQK